MSGPGQGVDEVATSGTMWYASRMKNGSRSQPARHTRSIPLVMISLTQEILMALERSSRCCEETLPLFFTWRRQYSRLLFSNFLVLSPIESLSHTRTHARSLLSHSLSPASMLSTRLGMRQDPSIFGSSNVRSSFSILLIFESEIGFFRRFCHSKIMRWLCPFTSSSYILTRGRERLWDILNTARRRGCSC